jgi:HD-like signal output (HDOD) protein
MTTRREVFSKLNDTKKLPTPSQTALEIMRLCSLESTSLNEISQVIQTDPALSAELLKYANAAFLSTGIQVASVQKATVKLGMDTVVRLALGFSLLSHNKKGKCRAFPYDKFWSTALLQAIAAKTIAAVQREYDPDEIFVCGLLSHIGELSLASVFPNEYEEIIVGNPTILIRETMEKDKFQISSSELTTELFLDWGLPAHYALAAGFHMDLDYAELGIGMTQGIAELLNIAYRIADICRLPYPDPEILLELSKTAEKFGIAENDFGSIYDTVIQQWQEWGSLFNIKTQQCKTYSEILEG